MTVIRKSLAAICVAGLTISATPSFAAENARTAGAHTALSDEQGASIKKYMEDHPGDLVGAEKLIISYGGAPLDVTMNGIEEPMTAAEAAIVSERRNASYRPDRDNRAVSPMAIPVDAFDVKFSFVPIGQFKVLATGTWNFRDNFVGTGLPDDYASVQLDGPCITAGETLSHSYRYDNVETANGTYLQDAGLSSKAPIVGIRDTTSGFATSNDHGVVTTEVEGHCGPSVWKGAFAYEHNQGGGSMVSISAGIGALSVSYSGSVLHLQKSTQIVEYTP